MLFVSVITVSEAVQLCDSKFFSDPGGSAPQVSNARPIGSNGVPGYVIGIIVAAIILALVVLAVGLLVVSLR